jgi:protein-L-isoaspartate(D-aspartate) O-methyltransferase
MLGLLRRSGITSAAVLDAMAAVPREEFVRAIDRSRAYDDRALPIDFGQTISQPLMVALIVQALEVEPGMRVLDVGTGSGYQAAVIAACGAVVVSIERIAELAGTAKERLARLGLRVNVRVGDGGLGLPGEAPFDRIAVAAAVPQSPATLISQLGRGGRMVYPQTRGNDVDELVRVTATEQGPRFENLGPCRFVHLIGHQGFDA